MVWRYVTLGDLFACSTRNGIYKASKFHGSGIKVVNMGDIFKYDFISDQPQSRYILSDEEYEQFELLEGDLIFARRSLVDSGAGKTSLIVSLKERLVFESSIIRVRLNRKICNPMFYLYWFKSFEGQSVIRSIVSGTSVRGIKSSDLFNLKVAYPSLNEQSKIASFLYSLDQMCNCLKRINDNLLEQLSLIYDSLDKSKWISKEAHDYFEVGIGKTPPRKEFEWFSDSSDQDSIRWVSISDMGKCGTYISKTSETLTRDAVETFNIRLVPNNTVLLSFKLTVGRVAITDGEMCTNEAIAHFKTNDERLVEVLYLQLLTYNYDDLGSTSSIATAVNSQSIKHMELIMPPEDQLTSIHSSLSPMCETIRNNLREINRLQSIRDVLLPKLMSGEIDVSALELPS